MSQPPQPIDIFAFMIDGVVTNRPVDLVDAVVAGKPVLAAERAALAFLIDQMKAAGVPPADYATFLNSTFSFDPAASLLTYHGPDTAPWQYTVIDVPFRFLLATTCPYRPMLVRNMVLDTTALMNAVVRLAELAEYAAEQSNKAGLYLMETPTNAELLALLRLSLSRPVFRENISQAKPVLLDLYPTELCRRVSGVVYQGYLLATADSPTPPSATILAKTPFASATLSGLSLPWPVFPPLPVEPRRTNFLFSVDNTDLTQSHES